MARRRLPSEAMPRRSAADRPLAAVVVGCGSMGVGCLRWRVQNDAAKLRPIRRRRNR
ncbi:MAG: hypothetical protein IKI28_08580 [Bacteroidales bacterium]|nr:hypothetical protein [Bacteroidales bacterium]